MIQYPQTIRNFNCFIDGYSYAGRTTDGKPPAVKLQTASHRAAGMDGPTSVDMGTEDMKAEGIFAEWSPALVTLIGTNKRLTFRPAAKGRQIHEAAGFVMTMGGLWTETSFGDLKPGNDSPLKLTLDCDYFRVVKDGEELFEIDILAGKRVVGGLDQIGAIREKMGF